MTTTSKFMSTFPAVAVAPAVLLRTSVLLMAASVGAWSDVTLALRRPIRTRGIPWSWAEAYDAAVMASTSLRAAIDEVAGRDPVLAQLVARVGPIRHRPRDAAGPFGALVRAIVFQQLAGHAAQAIYARVQTAVGGTLTPEALMATSDEVLRAAGLSANKLASLRDLSARVLDGTVVLARTSRRSDEELVARLTSVRGIGRWTAEMYLMFQLRRLDVWPVDDLGVRQGYGLAWGIDPPPTAKQLDPLGERFRPYRSIVARYCWAAVPLLRPGATDAALR
jgi:3-methyladenine DNA glycosylase/8-oxoguanine DNA glycosylase